MNYLLLFILIFPITTAQAENHRSQKAKSIFKYEHPCPSPARTKGSCPNYIIDHIKPLACGGLDDASNMQWQTH